MVKNEIQQHSRITKAFSQFLNRFHIRMSVGWRIAMLFFADIFCLQAAALGALLLRFEFTIPNQYMELYKEYIFQLTAIMLVVFMAFRLYRSLWRYASVDELVRIVFANIVGVLILRIFIELTGGRMPRSFYYIFLMIATASTGGIRFMYRYFRQLRTMKVQGVLGKKRTLIVGAGQAGNAVISEMLGNAVVKSFPVGLIDDDPIKKNKTVHGIKVLGDRHDIPAIAIRENIDEIILAMPRVDSKDRKEIIDICKGTACKLKTLPGIYELIDGKVSVTKIRDVSLEDLLGREPVKTDIKEICGDLNGKTVMVTGGAGSIGSELSRQIARFKPKRLVIVDVNENTTYLLQRDLQNLYPDLALSVHIASIRDRARMENIFKTYMPEKVYHAAAHKHVPLMETDPIEAVKNNVLGTLNIVELSDKYAVKKFVMISTDKAVNPTSVMGATKRIAEKIIQAKNKESKTDYVAVRFGNVLGSSGSVIPLFKRQIEEGGPVTVTHKDIIRYFMLIPEAVSLVLQAGTMARGGEVFVLDMGDPVKIMDLARDLIRLSGLEVGKDIDIEITGLRPGEKLYEELLTDEEGIKKTDNNKIFIGRANNVNMAILKQDLDALRIAAEKENRRVVEMLLRKIVPSYKSELKENLLTINEA